MTNKTPPFKGLNVRIPIIIPIKAMGFVNWRSTLPATARIPIILGLKAFIMSNSEVEVGVAARHCNKTPLRPTRVHGGIHRSDLTIYWCWLLGYANIWRLNGLDRDQLLQAMKLKL